MAVAPKPLPKRAVVAKPIAKPVIAAPIKQGLPPGVNPAVARQQMANANMARSADILSDQQGRPSMAGDYSNTMRGVPASVQNLTGSRASIPNPVVPQATKVATSTGQLPRFAGRGAGGYQGYGNFGGNVAGQRSSGQSFGGSGGGNPFGNMFGGGSYRGGSR